MKAIYGQAGPVSAKRGAPRALIAAYRRSGKSQAAFCRDHGVNATTFNVVELSDDGSDVALADRVVTTAAGGTTGARRGARAGYARPCPVTCRDHGFSRIDNMSGGLV